MIKKIKQYFKSKTIWLSIFVVLLSALNAYFEANLTPQEYSGIGVILAAAIGYLRGQTTQAIEDK